MKRRVAIIGAGASGLPSIRHALLYDFEPVCFEMTNDIGGLWNFKPKSGEEASVMKSTIINTSKEMTAYSDFPPPTHFANFMHNTKMLQYFREYANHYGLLKHIRFEHKVANVKRAKTYENDGKWDVQFEFGGVSQWETFDAVLICTGHHKTPYLPQPWPGQEKFRGSVLHSHDYKTPAGYEDRRVLCVGVGNSGLDISIELSRVCKQVFLSTRRGAWIFHRISDSGRPIDMVLGSRLNRSSEALLPLWWREKVVEGICNRRFDHDTYGLKPDFGPFATHISINDELPNRIASGTIKVVRDISKFDENGVVFKDGTREDVDTVVLSTGYRISLPMLEEGQLVPVEGNWVRLYKNMFDPELKHQTMAVIGLIQPLGSIMPISEMQARLFFAQFSGDLSLPSPTEMNDEIGRYHERMRQMFIASPRHTIQVNYMQYMDDLASMIGCLPNYWRMLRTDPLLAFYSITNPNAAYNYRITGPHSWNGAREAVMGIQERTGFAELSRRESAALLVKAVVAVVFITCLCSVLL